MGEIEDKVGIEVAGTVLGIFDSVFIAAKCAFFVYEEREGAFLSYAATGYDKSTRNRMFFPEEKLKSLFGWDEESLFLTKKNDLLIPYLSQKEFDLLDQILLIPFIFDSEFLGFLMITQCDFFEDPNLLRSVSELMEPISQLVFKKRFEPLLHMTSDIYPVTSHVITLINQLADEGIEDKKKLLFLSFEVWMAPIYSDNYILPYCAKGDLLAIIGAMVYGDGKVIDLPGSGILLLFPASRMDDSELFIHQITKSCQRVFPSIGNDITLSLKSLDFDITQQDLLSEFLGSIEDEN